MKISVIAPIKNEVDFVGYSIMSVLPNIHEIIYACAASDDGTDQLLDGIKERYAKEKLILLRKPEYDFNVHDMEAYNKAFNDCIDVATGDAVWFLHPDMIVTNPEQLQKIDAGPLAWYVNMTSFAGDMQTVITEGRATAWKNIYLKKFDLHYYGGYGSQNEDFYFRDITGDVYRHHGMNFKAYPYEVGNSGVNVNHYCETKPYKRRLEKMKACLKTLSPTASDERIHEAAASHPRVTLENGRSAITDNFVFEKKDVPVPVVFEKYKAEFDIYKKGLVLA